MKCCDYCLGRNNVESCVIDLKTYNLGVGEVDDNVDLCSGCRMQLFSALSEIAKKLITPEARAAQSGR